MPGRRRVADEGRGITRPDGPGSWRLALSRDEMLTGTYTLTVTNAGPDSVSAAVVTDTLGVSPPRTGVEITGSEERKGKRYYTMCDLLVAETTCDGKKKAYELFNELTETFVIETPQMKSPADRSLWRSEIDRLVKRSPCPVEIFHLSGASLTEPAPARSGTRSGIRRSDIAT